MDLVEKKAGFALLDVMVSIAIVVIISSLIFVNYKSTQKEGALLRSAQKLAQDLRRAQNMATSTVAIGTEIREYYGLNLSSVTPQNKSYIIFIDLNGNQIFDAPAGTIETISLESGVQIFSFTPATPSNRNIVFRAPFGETTLTSDLIITLSLIDDTNKTKSVRIYPSGRIEIQ